MPVDQKIVDDRTVASKSASSRKTIFMMTRKTVLSQTLLAAFVTALLFVACATNAEARPQKGKQSAAVGGTVTVTDPVEGSFKVQLPKGWRNQAYLVRHYELYRTVVTSMSPDGKTLLFYGDPRLPGYLVPTPYMNAQTYTFPMNPLMKFAEYESAEPYFVRYVREKFGKLPGFRITGTGPNPELLNLQMDNAKKAKRDIQATAVRITFDYTDNGKPMHALINGATMMLGTVWISDFGGITTPGDPTKYNGTYMNIVSTFRANPQWMAKQQQLHEQRMAQLRQDHANMLASFSVSNRNHELRMKSIQDAGDASMQRWYQNQAQSDKTHRSFLNYITDEHTVVDSSGKAFQVDNSHEKYFIHKRNNTYIGTKSTMDLDDLRRLGLNPDDYTPTKIKQ